MFVPVITAEAVVSTAIAAYAMTRWAKWMRAAKKASARADGLDIECNTLSGHVTRLSTQVDELRKQAGRKKPGPTKRASEKALVASKTAELIREIAL